MSEGDEEEGVGDHDAREAADGSPAADEMRAVQDEIRGVEHKIEGAEEEMAEVVKKIDGIKATVRNSGGLKTWLHLQTEITEAFDLAETLNVDHERQVLTDALIRGKQMLKALTGDGSSDIHALTDIMTVFTRALPNPHGVPDSRLMADLDTLNLIRKLSGNKHTGSKSATTAAAPAVYVPTPFAAAAPVGGYAHPGPAATPQQQQVSLPLAGTTKGAPKEKKAGGAAKPPLLPRGPQG
eukprot:g9626.t1